MIFKFHLPSKYSAGSKPWDKEDKASVCSKNKREGGGGGPPGSLPWIRHWSAISMAYSVDLRPETPNIQDIFGLFMTSQGKGTREGLLKPTKNLGFHNSKNLAQKLSRVLL